MSLKLFWKDNKKGFIYSCLAILLGGLFIGVIKKVNVQDSLPLILLCFPLCFIMAYGIYEFTGGDK
jgi:hypothetical protein